MRSAMTTIPYRDWHAEFYRTEALKPSAFDTQIAGTHYRDMAMQPIEFILANKLGFCEGSAIKYICRYKAKNGVEDLQKARHYIDMLIEQENKNGYNRSYEI